MSPRIWLAGTRLEVREQPHHLMKSVECCVVIFPCSPNVSYHRCYRGRICSGILQVLRNCSPRICCTLSSVVLALRFVPTFIFVTSTCVEGACVWLLTCLMNSSVEEFYCCMKLHIFSLKNTFPQTYVIRRHLFNHVDVSIFDKFPLTFLSQCELHFLHYFHNFIFPSHLLHVICTVKFTPHLLSILLTQKISK